MARQASVTRLPDPGARHLHPSLWPTLWLRYPGSYDPNDQQRTAQRGFRAWQRARSKWREKHTRLTAGAFHAAAYRELMRRRPAVEPTTLPG